MWRIVGPLFKPANLFDFLSLYLSKIRRTVFSIKMYRKKNISFHLDTRSPLHRVTLLLGRAVVEAGVGGCEGVCGARQLLPAPRRLHSAVPAAADVARCRSSWRGRLHSTCADGLRGSPDGWYCVQTLSDVTSLQHVHKNCLPCSQTDERVVSTLHPTPTSPSPTQSPFLSSTFPLTLLFVKEEGRQRSR